MRRVGHTDAGDAAVSPLATPRTDAERAAEESAIRAINRVALAWYALVLLLPAVVLLVLAVRAGVVG